MISHRLGTATALAVGACAVLALPPASRAQLPTADQLYEQMLANPDDDMLFERFKKALPHDAANTYFVVEGDIRMTEKELRRYVDSLASTPRPAEPGRELLLSIWNNKRDYWVDRASRHLTYAVDRASFPSAQEYNQVVTNMAAAGRNWADVCSACGVRFEHLLQFDARPTLTSVVFIVKRNQTPAGYVAMAFFPHEAQGLRYLYVDPSYFTTSFDRVGVLRHELGHVLGYRHEHIVGIPGCRLEGGDWQPLTKYDPHSVMHYFCGSGGTMTLALTDVDKRGHRSVYGK